jgi:hypothetical protein
MVEIKEYRPRLSGTLTSVPLLNKLSDKTGAECLCWSPPGCLDENLQFLQNDGCEWPRTIDLRQHLPITFVHMQALLLVRVFPPLPVLTRLR